MSLPSRSRIFRKDAEFERATRQIRWAVIIITFATFPLNTPQTLIVYGMTGLAVLYNLSRYIPSWVHSKRYGSPIAMLAIDNLFVLSFLCVIHTLVTPYSALLVFMIISSALRYGLRGMLTVTLAQATLLVASMALSPFPPIALDDGRSVVTSLLMLMAIGLFVERLTWMDRHERSALRTLSEETSAERERLLTLINTLDDAIFVLDAKGRVQLSNGVAQELTGYKTPLQLIELSAVLPLRPRAKPRAKPVQIMEAGPEPQRRRDLSLFQTDGTAVDLDIHVTPVHAGNEKDISFIVVCRDITKERSLERQREEFISVASHELRTPLTILEAALSTALLTKNLAPQLTILLEQAHRNAVFLASLTKDLTTLAQAQNDNIPIALAPVNPGALLHQLAIDFTPEAKLKNLPLQVVIAPDMPPLLTTEHHIREVLQNYVSNALKYTTEGHITLKAAPGKNGSVLFSVTDTGLGISVNDQQQLFSKFYRAEDYRTRQTSGTGLGLYLCLELALRLNAKVWCKSVLNEGSTFFLEVPPFSRLERDHGKVTEAQVSSLVDQL